MRVSECRTRPGSRNGSRLWYTGSLLTKFNKNKLDKSLREGVEVAIMGKFGLKIS